MFINLERITTVIILIVKKLFYKGRITKSTTVIYRRSLNASIRSNSLSIINQQSGGTLSTFYIALVDQFNQIVGADSSSTSTITISGNYVGAVYSPLLKGATTQTASNGAFKFTDISFTAQPGTSYSKLYSI